MKTPASNPTHHNPNSTWQPPLNEELRPFPRDFYTPAADIVAPQLLGHWLLRRTEIDGQIEICGGIIVETEAYLVDDPACHAYVRQTPRNRAMWGEQGRAYVFQIYGAYHCINAVCRPRGEAEAVLVRAIRPIIGTETMQRLRPDQALSSLTNGPGKLCRALQIDRALDESDLCAADSPLWIARNPDANAFCERFGPMITTTRIGLTRGVESPLRFYLDGDVWVSKRAAKKRPAVL